MERTRLAERIRELEAANQAYREALQLVIDYKHPAGKYLNFVNIKATARAVLSRFE